MKGILAAKKKPVQTWSLADLGVDPADVGLDAAWTTRPRDHPAAAPDGRPGGDRRGRRRRRGAGGVPRRRQVRLTAARCRARSREEPPCPRSWSSPSVADGARRQADAGAADAGPPDRRPGRRRPRRRAPRPPRPGSASTAPPGCCRSTDPALAEYLVAPKAEALAQVVAAESPGRGAAAHRGRGQGGRGPAGRQARLGADHRRRRRRRRRLDHPGRLRGRLQRARRGHPRRAGDHRQAELRDARARTGLADGRAGGRHHLRRRQGRPDRPPSSRAPPAAGPSLAEAAVVVSGRPGHRRQLRPGRAAGRHPRRGRGRLPGRGRLRLVPARLPGGPDRQDRLAAALRRRRHLGRHPAPRRHADLEGGRRGQQGRRGADLRAGRPRRRRRPAPGAARGQPPQVAARKG